MKVYYLKKLNTKKILHKNSNLYNNFEIDDVLFLSIIIKIIITISIAANSFFYFKTKTLPFKMTLEKILTVKLLFKIKIENKKY